MYKVYLTDNTLTGHHKVYLETLLELKNVVDISSCREFESSKKKLNYIFDRKDFIDESIKRSNTENFQGNKILHFLYLDNLYTTPFLWRRHKTKNIKIIGTLHHMPQNKIKMLCLKLWSNKLDCIIVHSEYIQEQLLLEGIKNVRVIDYPSFYDYSQYPFKDVISKEMNIPDDKVVISALGGTRFDKGLDILLESFRFLDSKDKNKILLNIVGREETFKKEFILEKIQKYEINARVELGFVNDDDFAKNILISDYIVLPYRKIFTGNSGPMTEAIVNEIPIISPEYGNLGYLSRKYNLGETFNDEDSNSLAKALKSVTQKNEYGNRDYRERLNIPSFVAGYEKIYKELNQDV